MNMTKNEKEEQLAGLVQLVTGIRLFNRELGKGSAGLDNVPMLCDTELLEAATTINQLTKASEESTLNYALAADFLELEESMPELQGEERQKNANNCKSGLVFRRQLLLYLTALQEQMNSAREHLKELNEKYESAVRDLKHICRAKSAVPVDMVYVSHCKLN